MVLQVNAILIYEWLRTDATQISFQGDGRSTLPKKLQAALPTVPSPNADLILLAAGDDGAISQVEVKT